MRNGFKSDVTGKNGDKWFLSRKPLICKSFFSLKYVAMGCFNTPAQRIRGAKVGRGHFSGSAEANYRRPIFPGPSTAPAMGAMAPPHALVEATKIPQFAPLRPLALTEGFVILPLKASP